MGKMDRMNKTTMIRTASIPRISIVAVAVWAMGCGPTRNATITGDSALGNREANLLEPDTTFVELRRFEDRGSPLTNGGCGWRGGPLPSPSNPAIKKFILEERTVSMDREACTRVVAQGYRRAAPIRDTANGESRAITITIPPPRIDSGVSCTADARPAIIVDVSDAVSGHPLSDVVTTLVVRDGDRVVDSVTARNAARLFAANERRGTYTIVVRTSGYLEWRRDSVVVTGDVCHVNPVTLTARLKRR